MKFQVISGIISDLNVRYPISFPYQLFPISQFSNPGVCVGDLAAHLDFWDHSGPGLVGTPGSVNFHLIWLLNFNRCLESCSMKLYHWVTGGTFFKPRISKGLADHIRVPGLRMDRILCRPRELDPIDVNVPVQNSKIRCDRSWTRLGAKFKFYGFDPCIGICVSW